MRVFACADTGFASNLISKGAPKRIRSVRQSTRSALSIRIDLGGVFCTKKTEISAAVKTVRPSELSFARIGCEISSSVVFGSTALICQALKGGSDISEIAIRKRQIALSDCQRKPCFRWCGKTHIRRFAAYVRFAILLRARLRARSRRSGEMVDTPHSKCGGGNPMSVQVRPSVH